jgi:hypothetical protein
MHRHAFRENTGAIISTNLQPQNSHAKKLQHPKWNQPVTRA